MPRKTPADGRPTPARVTFETLFDQSPFSTQILSPDGFTIRVNRAWEELWGVTLDQMRDYNMLADPQLAAAGLMPYIERGFSGEVVEIPAVRYDPDATLPNRTRHKDPARWVRGFMSPVRDGRGRLLHVVLVHQDVSIEKRSEEEISAALREQTSLRDRLAALTEASGTLLASLAVADVLPAIGAIAARLIAADAYAVWTDRRGSADWEIAWHHELSGDFMARLEPLTAPFPDATAVLTEPLFVEQVEGVSLLATRQDAYRAEGIQSLVIIPLRIAGLLRGTVVAYYRDRRSFSDSERRLAVAFGNLASTAMTTAELYEAQRTLRASAEQAERRAAFLAEAGSILSSSLDYQETLRTVARLAVPHIGDWCAVDVAAGQRLERLAVAHVDPAKVDLARTLEERYPETPDSPSVVRRVIQSGSSAYQAFVPDEVLVAAARNSQHLEALRNLGVVSYMCVPLRAHGETYGAITLVSTQESRRYTEADVRFAEDLASRAAMSIANARSYDDAREASRLKDEFLATLSHELRTPLNAILGYARMLQGGIFTPEQQARAIGTLERNATSLSQLVEDILDVSRIIAGKMRLDIQPVDLRQVLRDAIATIAPAAGAKHISLELLGDDVDARTSADGERLQQVVWNLLSNAVKFTPTGGRVQVQLCEASSHLEIAVVDNGVGISAEFLPYVFERFRQADSRFSREYGGLGLGLAIARHIVEMHGGRVSAESAGEGQGTTFRISLPRGGTPDVEFRAERRQP